jgi:hypothetical protein
LASSLAILNALREFLPEHESTTAAFAGKSDIEEDPVSLCPTDLGGIAGSNPGLLFGYVQFHRLLRYGESVNYVAAT